MMGLFSTQSKLDPREGPDFEEDLFEEDAFDTITPQKAGTVIAQGMIFTGTLRGEGDVQIDGRLEGEVDLKGALTVTVGGEVCGPVCADVVQVAGIIQGDITARESLRLEQSGTIHGDVSALSLIIEKGRLDGRSTMLKPGRASASAAAPAAPKAAPAPQKPAPETPAPEKPV